MHIPTWCPLLLSVKNISIMFMCIENGAFMWGRIYCVYKKSKLEWSTAVVFNTWNRHSWHMLMFLKMLEAMEVTFTFIIRDFWNAEITASVVWLTGWRLLIYGILLFHYLHVTIFKIPVATWNKSCIARPLHTCVKQEPLSEQPTRYMWTFFNV